MSEITTFLDMTSAQRTAWFTSLMTYNNTPEKKVKALLFCRRIMQNDRQKNANDAAIVASVDNDIRSRLTTLMNSDPSLFSSLFPPVYPSSWNYQGSQHAKYKPSAAGITKIEALGLTNADANAIEFYLAPDVRKALNFVNSMSVDYTNIVQNYPYSVMLALIPDSSQPDLNDKAYLWLAVAATAGSNNWTLAIIKKSQLDPVFPIVTPTNGIICVNAIGNYTFGSQGTVSVPGSNPNFQVRIPNDVTFVSP